jgi:imidazolonepropionase-like amidohydrolase
LAHGRVFDGTGELARPGSVVIRRNQIVGVLEAGDTDWPAEAQVIDVTGKTIMPGLINLHCHPTLTMDYDAPLEVSQSTADATLRGVERLRIYLESGITSIRDPAGHADAPFRLKAWVNDNRIPGPRIFAVGRLITGTGGHVAEEDPVVSAERGTFLEVNGPDAWRAAAREEFKRGADLIKIASHFSQAEVEAVVDEAHRLGLKVMCDAETDYIRMAVEAGVDTIEHPLPRTDETIALMAERGTQAVPTLVAYIIVFDAWGGYHGSTSRRFSFSKEANLEMLRRMKRAEVVMGIGTDLIGDWDETFPWCYITELQQFVAAGFTIPEVLCLATKTNAEILDMDDKLGTLEVGNLADVLVVDGRPDEELDDLAKVDLVIRDGHVVVRDGQALLPPRRHKPMPEPRN